MKAVEIKQKDMVVAWREKNVAEAVRLQNEIVMSFAGRALSVRKVVSSTGAKTAGMDKLLWNTPVKRYKAIEELRSIVRDSPESYQPGGIKRIWISKNPKELRSSPLCGALGIPNMIDRALQAVIVLAIDPIIEEISDELSFGFRKERGSHDAIRVIGNIFDKPWHPEYVWDADIEKCFDNISHDFLMKAIKPLLLERGQTYISKWLRDKIHDKGKIITPSKGIPQGGVISPLLCNVALNGLEGVVRSEELFNLPVTHRKDPATGRRVRKDPTAGLWVIRYADDFIITSRSPSQLEEIIPKVTAFLKERGLNVSAKKSKILNITEHKLEYLGWEIARMRRLFHKNKEGKDPTVLVIRPSKKAIRKIKNDVSTNFKTDRPIGAIIRGLNPILRGWTNYYRTSYHSQEVFQSLGHHIYKIWKGWSDRKHRSKTRDWIHRKYIFAVNEGAKIRTWRIGASPDTVLVEPSTTKEWKITNRKVGKNPYFDIEYFLNRPRLLEANKFRLAIYKKHNYLCAACRSPLDNSENVELHHIKPKSLGGEYTLDNIVPLHEICHKGITHAGKQVYDSDWSKATFSYSGGKAKPYSVGKPCRAGKPKSSVPSGGTKSNKP